MTYRCARRTTSRKAGSNPNLPQRCLLEMVVLRKISSRDGLQQVVMMQAAETRAGSDAMSGGYAMYGQCGLVRRVIWKSRANAECGRSPLS